MYPNFPACIIFGHISNCVSSDVLKWYLYDFILSIQLGESFNKYCTSYSMVVFYSGTIC